MDPENEQVATEQNAANKRAVERAHRQRLARSRGAAALDGKRVEDWFVLPHENDPTSSETNHVCLGCCAAVRAERGQA